MKKIIFTFILFILLHQLSAQKALSNYQYWFDQNYAAAQYGIQTNDEFIANIPANGLSFGLHSFHYRAKDSTGKWSAVVSQEFYKPCKLTTYEYWFDGNYAIRTAVTASPVNIVNVTTTASATNLNYGLHNISLRSKNEAGKWSSVVTQQFYKAPKMVSYEYWFDTNYAGKISVTSAATDVLDVNTLISASALSFGLHEIHIRSKNQKGIWSSAITHSFRKESKIDKYEYWFDNAYSSKVTQTLSTPLSSLDINDLISTLSLSGTHHTIHIRTHKQDGKWSSTLSQDFTKQNHIQPGNSHEI